MNKSFTKIISFEFILGILGEIFIPIIMLNISSFRRYICKFINKALN